MKTYITLNSNDLFAKHFLRQDNFYFCINPAKMRGEPYNRALIEALSDPEFWKMPILERIRILAQYPPCPLRRSEVEKDARRLWRERVFDTISMAVQEYGTAFIDTLPHHIKSAFFDYSAKIHYPEPVISDTISVRGTQYTLSIQRSPEGDRWYASLGDYKNHIYLKTGHLSPFRINFYTVVHDTPEGVVVTVVVFGEGKRLPAAMDFFRREGQWMWMSTPWREKVDHDDAKIGPLGNTKCRQGDLILEVVAGDIGPVIPYRGPEWWENHRIHCDGNPISPVINQCGEVGFVASAPISVQHPEHLPASLIPESFPVFVRVRQASGRTQYSPPTRGGGD